jgi:hypothetical protein
LLMEEPEVTRENHQPDASHWQTVSHNVVSGNTLQWAGFTRRALVMICTDCIGSGKSNCHATTTATAQQSDLNVRPCCNLSATSLAIFRKCIITYWFDQNMKNSCNLLQRYS